MILDSLTEFCDAVSVAAVAGTTLVGSQIDTGILANVGAGGLPYLVITVDTAIATGGAAGTIQFKLASDDTASISTTTSTIHLITPLYTTDDNPTIPAGQVLFIGQLPHGLPGWTGDNTAYERYLGILSVVGTTTTSAGKINAFLTMEPGVWQAKADATN